MRIQIEPTDKVMTIDGIPCRLWNGITDDGVHCFLLIHRIGVHFGEDATKFDKELEEINQPSVVVISSASVGESS